MPFGIEFEDRLAVLGTLVGAFVIIVGLATLISMPWATNESTAAVAVQMVGIVATIAIGGILILITYATEPGKLLPS